MESACNSKAPKLDEKKKKKKNLGNLVNLDFWGESVQMIWEAAMCFGNLIWDLRIIFISSYWMSWEPRTFLIRSCSWPWALLCSIWIRLLLPQTGDSLDPDTAKNIKTIALHVLTCTCTGHWRSNEYDYPLFFFFFFPLLHWYKNLLYGSSTARRQGE